MFPFGALISLAGSAASGIMSAINNRKAEDASNAEYTRQQTEARKRANEDPLMRSENQRILNEYDRRSKRDMTNQANTGVITGETQEAVLARQKAAIEGRADLMSNMASVASANRDYYLDREEESKRAQATAEQQRLAARDQTYANLAANAANAFGNIVDSYGTPSAEVKTEEKVVEVPAVNNEKKYAAKLRTGMAAPTNFVEKKSADAYVDPTNLVQQAEDKINFSKKYHPVTFAKYLGFDRPANVASGDYRRRSLLPVQFSLPTTNLRRS